MYEGFNLKNYNMTNNHNNNAGSFFHKRFLKLIFSIIIVSLVSCETEVDSSLFNENEPVVYCLLNPYDSVHYLRLERTFSGGEDIRKSAKIADSIYYSSPNVSLEIWSDKDWMIYQKEFEKTLDFSKESGYFLSNTNPIYKLSENMSLYLETGYRLLLIVKVPEDNYISTSITEILSIPEIILPAEAYRARLTIYGHNPTIIKWEDLPKHAIYELRIRMYYTEVKQSSEELTYVDVIYELNSLTDINSINQRFFREILNPDLFYAHIKSNIKPDSTIIVRKFDHIDIILKTASQEFRDFMEINQFADDNVGRPITNVIKGLGIFSTYYETSVKNFLLDVQNQDSLRYGQFTKHLNFRFWE